MRGESDSAGVQSIEVGHGLAASSRAANGPVKLTDLATAAGCLERAQFWRASPAVRAREARSKAVRPRSIGRRPVAFTAMAPAGAVKGWTIKGTCDFLIVNA